jgi:tetratricopeptide (TPR) repeat protein/ADP-ribose pyrophosphatase YjhB (NUDIX family)
VNRWYYAVIISLLVILSITPGNADNQTGCETADELYNEGNYEEALLAYTVLWDLYAEPCANIGIIKSRKALHEQAERLYEIGEALDKAGHEELAIKAYISAVEKDPSYTDPIQALDDAAMAKTTTASSIVDKSAEFLKTIYRAIFQIIIFALILIVLWLKIGPWIVGSIQNKPRLDIECFEKGSAGLEIGKGLAVRVEDEFKMCVNERDVPLAKLVEGPISLKAPAEIGSAAPHIKILSDLAEWAFPQNVITLCGCLQKSEDNGAGLTLKMKSNQTGEVIAACTLWQLDYDSDWKDKKSGKAQEKDDKQDEDNGVGLTLKMKSNQTGEVMTACALRQHEHDEDQKDKKNRQDEDPYDYFCLAEPAAIWTLFNLLEHEEGIEPQKEKKKSVLGLGTEDWKSYVFFRYGRNEDLRGNVGEARKHYLRALQIDPENRYALSNFGILTTEEGAREESDYMYEEAIELLKRAKKLSEEYEKSIKWLGWMKRVIGVEICKHVHGDNIWFAAMRNLAGTYHYEGDYESSIREVTTLLHAIVRTLDVIKSVREREGKAYRKFWNWTIWGIHKKIIEKRFLKEKIGEWKCFSLIEPKNDYLEEINEIEGYLKELKNLTILLRAISLAKACKIRNTTGYIEQILNKMKESKEKKPGQEKDDQEEINYDLACYYSVAGEKKGNGRTDEYDKALKCLRDALLEGGIMLDWARSDPDLRGLRTDRGREFNKLIDTYTAEIPDSEKLSYETEKEKVEAQIRRINTKLFRLQGSSPPVAVIVLLYNKEGTAIFKQGTDKWVLPERAARGNENLDLAVFRTLCPYVLNSHRVEVESSIFLPCKDREKNVVRFNCVVVARMDEIYGRRLNSDKKTEVFFVSESNRKEKYMEYECHKELLERHFADTLKEEVTCSCPGIGGENQSKSSCLKIGDEVQRKSSCPRIGDENQSKNAGEDRKENVQFPMPLIRVEGVLLAFSKKDKEQKEFRGIMLVKKASCKDKGAGKWVLPSTFVKACKTAASALKNEVKKYEIDLPQDSIFQALKDRIDPGRDPDYFVWTQSVMCYFIGEPKSSKTEDVRTFPLKELPWDDMPPYCQDILKECIASISGYVDKISSKNEGAEEKEAKKTGKKN